VSRPTLYVVRHGETDWNLKGRLQGQKDVPLNDLGRAQAQEAGRRLLAAAADVEGLDYLASPMARARETMEIMRATMGLDPRAYRIDGRLVELTFGAWEGLTWREVRKAYPEKAAARERDKWAYVPPHGESYSMLAERVRPILDDLPRPAVIVAHGGIARALLALIGGVPRHCAASVDIWQGSILVFRDGRYEWV